MRARTIQKNAAGWSGRPACGRRKDKLTKADDRRLVRLRAILPQRRTCLARGEKRQIVLDARLRSIFIERVGVDARDRFLRRVGFFGDGVDDLGSIGGLRHDLAPVSEEGVAGRVSIQGYPRAGYQLNPPIGQKTPQAGRKRDLSELWCPLARARVF